MTEAEVETIIEEWQPEWKHDVQPEDVSGSEGEGTYMAKK